MTAPSAGSGRPVLLFVEDHADSRAMYAEFLADRFEVLEAGDGEAAWTLLQQRRPDVVITDLALPILSGLELIQRIRAEADLREIPIIALSGYSSPDLPAAAARWDRLFEKPCLPEDLAEAAVQAASNRKKT